jgi:Uma2 family endonuclease
MAQSTTTQQPQEPGQSEYITYEAFLEWADEDTLAEWVDGAVVMTSPASLRHQDIMNFLEAIITTYTQIHELGKVTNAPFQMKLKHSGREPDLLFVAKEHLGRLKKTYLDGPADLVVEIISPESQERDRTDKFNEYREAGIPEYWLIDPEAEQALFYQLDEAGQYQTILPDAIGIYHSRAIPGFWLRVDWLWKDPLPDTTDALLEIDEQAYTSYLQERLKRRMAD